ncbi:hypothetical protein [Ammoniphilus sp. CFH 90114]|uniref:hypothetical protein n=1 Tax=Ammoniphilus sp. CFH 90114 TaxID=2493665 RepID=UPI00100EF978|nr:hypothetical protein [Ammoniphilus sp. CFH 90114]RXT07851.1 hypothetical protein EIZ39_10515 [Ammoniphilus sp. CFH 90114]
MGKKRKTYYLDEEIIQRVKTHAQQQQISENDAFEQAVFIYEKFYEHANQYIPISKEFQPLLLEAVDHMIYQSERMMQTPYPDPLLAQNVQDSLSARIAYLYEIRKVLTDTKNG